MSMSRGFFLLGETDMVPVIVSPSQMVNTSSRYSTVCFQCVARDFGPAFQTHSCSVEVSDQNETICVYVQIEYPETSKRLSRCEPVEKPSSLWHMVNDTSK